MQSSTTAQNPAIVAAEASLKAIFECIDQGKSFLLEAGAGSGKTYSLVKALRHVIEKQGRDLAKRSAKVACITFTNVASDEIKSRIDGHPSVVTSTIHAFCWSLIKDFQPFLKNELPSLPKWKERLEEGGGIAGRPIEYDFGFPSADPESPVVSVHHDDVLGLTVRILSQPKFRRLLVARHPVIFIDEYQDTDKEFVNALLGHFVGQPGGPLIGFFGDHWQKIYEEGTGGIVATDLVAIPQKSNFRSVEPVVEVLNRMRPELPQACSAPGSSGMAAAFHTNGWKGARRDGKGGGHWTGDLPPDAAHNHLEAIRTKLEGDGWEFSAEKTKILMLTHGVLATEQGYSQLAKVFNRTESFIKKEDSHIKFLLDTVEPVCEAYAKKRYGEMFAALDGRTPKIRSHADKVGWATDMSALLNARANGTVGDVLDLLMKTRRPRLPDSVERREKDLQEWTAAPEGEEPKAVARTRALRAVPYKEVVALAKFVDDSSPFSTKHGVKGAEFENVLVVAGRGWNHYNFNELLESFDAPPDQAKFQRNRNLFYVACSRPKKRLALLFTQQLSDASLDRLKIWFGGDNVQAFNL